MSWIGRFKALDSGKRTIASVVFGMLVTALPALLGWRAAMNNPGETSLGFGAVFVFMGLMTMVFIGSYNRFSRLLFFPIGAIVVYAGFGFAIGGMAQLVTEHPNYLTVWGGGLLLLSVLLALYGLYLHLMIGYYRRNLEVRARRNPKALQKCIGERAIVLPASYAIGGVAVVLLCSGWLLAL